MRKHLQSLFKRHALNFIYLFLLAGFLLAPPVFAKSHNNAFAVDYHAVFKAAPSITIGAVTGTINACAGTPSADPNLQQFSVSGADLTADISVIAPSGFEVSLSADAGFAGQITISQSGGTVGSTIVYVRSSATAAGGNISGNVLLTSGTVNQTAGVNGAVNSVPGVTVLPVANITPTETSFTISYENVTGAPIYYTVEAGATNAMPGFNLVSNFSIHPPSPIPVNIPATAPGTYNFTFSVRTLAGCSSVDIPFTVTVSEPPPQPVINLTGSLNAFGSCAGSPSAEQTFKVSGTHLTAAINLMAPAGFEISKTSGSGYGAQLTLTETGGVVGDQLIYTRITSSATGSPGGNITITSTGVTDQAEPVSGVVNALPVIILGAIDPVKTSSTTFSLPYSGVPAGTYYFNITTGSSALPHFNVINGYGLNGSPVSVNIPPSNAGTYDFNLTIYNVATGCYSAIVPFKLVVNKDNQSINFVTLADKTYGDADFTVAATATSGLPVTFTSDNTSVATVTGNTVKIIGAGTANISAHQAGDAHYYVAEDVPQPLKVNKAAEVIDFATIAPHFYGDADFTISAVSNNSAVPVTFVSLDPTMAAVSGNTVHILRTGTVNLVARQAGDDNHLAAIDALQSLQINKGQQTITFGELANKVFGNPPFAINATASSNLAVTFTSDNAAVATVSGNIVTITGGGTTNIIAHQPGNNNYNAAADISQPLKVNPEAPSVITFNPLQSKAYGDADFTISANSTNSAVPIIFTSANPAVATVTGNKVHIIKQGTTSIIAHQAADANHLAAADVPQALLINKATLKVTASNAVKVYGTPNPVFSVSYEGFVNGDTKLTLAKSASIATLATVTSPVGTYPIVPGGAVAENYTFSYVNGTLNITPGARTISFNQLPVKTYGDADFAAGAKASTGEAIIFSGYNTAVVTIVNGKIHIVGAGTTTVTATVAANANYTNTPSQSWVLTVKKANQYITFGIVPAVLKGTQYDLAQSITSSSGLPVTFSSTDRDIATVTGSVLNAIHIGTTIITASQAGNTNYNAATTRKGIVMINDAADDELIVHKAVSPNGDGKNDFLYIEGIDNYLKNKVTIINRNGVEVWQAQGYNNSSTRFDGHSNSTGDVQQAGTYFYKIEYIVNGTNKHIEGYFVLKYQ